MMLSREELARQARWHDVADEFIASKETRDSDPARYMAAKEAMRAVRAEMRSGRDGDDGIAEPATLNMTTGV